jgi:DNA processing protein
MTTPPSPEVDSSHNPDLLPDMLARLRIADLPKMSPKRARWLLSVEDAQTVVECLLNGRLPEVTGRAPSGIGPGVIANWSTTLRTTNPEELLGNQHEKGAGVLAPGDARWPFHHDPEPPALLFFQGDLDLLRPNSGVAVVGTRRCTSVGRTVAYQIGAELGAAGVTVLSGLALGVDGAAHRGTLDVGGSVVGVVGSGLDVVYPAANRSLWNEVVAHGLLLSEAPVGKSPQRWRFPARNRLIAGLAGSVVVVESHRSGGALHTVDEAVERGRPVMTVPGSVLSSASDGTNELLVDGAIPVRGGADVLGHLGFEVATPTAGDTEPGRDTEPGGGAGSVGEQLVDGRAARGRSELAELILAEAATGPVHLDRLISISQRPAQAVLAEVQALASSGVVVLDGSTVSIP